ncbi:MAG: hypothetical protein ACD_58C00177G0002 [uncultured bacterium]|nr:MAG: hypothetical protein ACD_58C00177G0002 [uncultured bacterium]
MRVIIETIYELFKTIIFVLIMAFLLRFFIFQPFMVQGISMEPNFHDSQYLIVDRLSYRIKEPVRGDVVVFVAPDHQNTDYIKRIIGLPGEKVEITDNKILINDSPINEKYLPSDYKTLINDSNEADLIKNLSQEEYFVMGDNRQHSLDSRIFGQIKKSAIIGRAWAVLYPLEYFGRVVKQSY